MSYIFPVIALLSVVLAIDDLCFCAKCGNCSSVRLTGPSFFVDSDFCTSEFSSLNATPTYYGDCCECIIAGDLTSCVGSNNCYDPSAACAPIACVTSQTCVLGTALDHINQPDCRGGRCTQDLTYCESLLSKTVGASRSFSLVRFVELILCGFSLLLLLTVTILAVTTRNRPKSSTNETTSLIE